MKTKEEQKNLISLILSMCIFGTIGIVRKYIDMPSSFIALCRAVIGTLFLLLVVALKKSRLDLPAIRKNLFWLALSSVFLGFNWILLFEAYNYTTVTTATLCYYMAPSIVVLASHFLFKERLNRKKGICVLVAFLGMVLVSGVLNTGIPSIAEIKGVLFGLAAALFYACVVLLNKKISLSSPFDRTIFQLGMAAIILLPYTFLTENVGSIEFTSVGIVLLIVAGIVHTGIPYALYFSSIKLLPAQTVALFSYIDPILAIILSALVLHEPIGVSEIIGAVLILGAAYFSEKS
ncbi:MAG: EamA family transporter [Oscillospiraceae bacterium]|nr:EamA family transporter [Oscillospiraceae bacterium]